METHDRASLRRPPLFLFIILLVLDKKGAFLSSMGMLLDEKRSSLNPFPCHIRSKLNS